MLELFVFARGLAVGLVLALVLACLFRYRRHYALRVLALFGLAICAYLLAPLLHGRSSAFCAAAAVSDTIPLLFLLFAQAVFEEHARPSRAALAAGATYLVAGYVGIYLPEFLPLPRVVAEPLRILARAMMMGFLGLAAVVILRNWREDLVRPRRLLRLVVTAVVCIYILAVVILETALLASAVPLWVEVLHTAGITCSTILVGAVLLLQDPDELAGTAPVEPLRARPTAAADQAEIGRIATAMEQDHLYRDMELTIGRLAAHLGIPEHRLRQHINRQLGYRNFNDFLNRYRVEEAATELRNPQRARIPILTIAMDAGYRSMTTFNKAFKTLHGLTPSEYRQKNLTDS
jgi:AraC-like DNA-binding protein